MSFLPKHNKENELILNTPNRLEILKEGPPINQIKTNLLGRGTYGTVIKAIYKGKPVALKIIKNVQDVHKEVTLNEANILGWLHPNIVRIFKIESTGNFSIVVMERFNGHCLQKILDTIQLPLIHRIFIAIDILSGLMFCHKRSLLHLDIKPQNIMIQLMYPKLQDKLKSHIPYRNYKCKLCDFGSSIKITKEIPTPLGLAKGTLRYMAPEVLKEETLTPAADIYSLGITLWQITYRLMPYYWLECNEVVAYQVVKHKLRPNSRQINIQQIAIECLHKCHDNCLCETNSTNLSYNSLENLRNILNNSKCELIANKITNVEYVEKKIMENKRKPLNNLQQNALHNHKKLNVKRDLQQDFMLIDHFSFSNIFQNDKIFMDSIEKEKMFEELFKSCWHSDFKERPLSGELLKQFKEFL
ncbi:proto-oncogene serine/threonine-protein kinase mos [Cochliomyia hominivorax]